MQSFAALLDRLVLTPQRNAKLRLMVDYFRATPDPDRGYALAALTGELDIPSVKPAMLRALVESRVDGVLFAYSYDYVGDLAETISLIWPSRHGANRSPGLAEVVERLQAASRSEGPKLVEGWLDALDATARWALIKLVVGGLRIGVSARLAKQALADLGDKQVNEIEEVWHGVAPPYPELFAWLEGRAPRPESTVRAPFRPVMLSHAISDDELSRITPAAYAAEWKWDGIRVQAVNDGGTRRLYTRTGDDISHAFPDLVAGLDVEGAIDGELLIGAHSDAGFALGSFSDLQQRLNRKTISGKLMDSHPAFLRAYDCLIDGSEDVRALSFRERRARLENLVGRSLAKRMDLSPLLAYRDGEELAALRGAPPSPVIEGLMLKRWDSVYEPGRPKGPWFKWKRDPHTVDAVLMYAQRGHGKRSSYYSDYTFGVWNAGDSGDELVPVGKAYFGFTDEELVEIDKFVRNNTINRFGPVREVVHEATKGLVLEVAFEGLQRSTRHRSGIAMRFPRIARLRWDKPPSEADRLETLEKLVRE
ncbi:MAG: cisplatin damage response ATP-dependent DNA ligase [Bauldia sp.]